MCVPSKFKVIPKQNSYAANGGKVKLSEKQKKIDTKLHCNESAKVKCVHRDVGLRPNQKMSCVN